MLKKKSAMKAINLKVMKQKAPIKATRVLKKKSAMKAIKVMKQKAPIKATRVLTRLISSTSTSFEWESNG